jgi:hypothetical protein
MAFEHLWDLFDFEDLANNFRQHFQMCSHIAASHIQRSIDWVLGIIKLLVLTKPSESIWPIMMGEVLYWLVKRILCL